MPDPSLTLPLAFAIFRFAFSAIAPEAAQVSNIIELGESLTAANLGASRQEKRRVVRSIEDAFDNVDSVLSRAESIEFRDLAGPEKALAIEGVVAALRGAQDLSIRSLIDGGIDDDGLKRRLLPTARAAWNRAALSGVAREYGEAYLTLGCRYAWSILRTLPDLHGEIGWRTYLFTQNFDERLQTAVADIVLPQFRLGTPMEHAQFESDYRQELVIRYRDVYQFGLTSVPSQLRMQRVDVAYVSLTATQRSGPSVGSRAPSPNSGEPVDRRLGAIASGPESSVRLLITGEPGSGKTTICQWLATQGGVRRLPSILDRWNRRNVFVLQLRKVFKPEQPNPQPSDEDLLADYSCRTRAPGGWIEQALSSGALLVVDGLDEVADGQRPAALNWIHLMTARYPATDIIVTSRPEAADANWFSSHSFTQLTLLPMDLITTEACVRRWFAALGTHTGLAISANLAASSDYLINDLRAKPSLRDLASSPLLCALLCAYYATGVVEAPRTRAELYRHVTEVLVDSRERDRGVDTNPASQVDAQQKSLLLRALAYDMFKSKKSTYSIFGRTDNFERSERSKKKQPPNLVALIDKVSRSDLSGPSSLELAKYLSHRAVVLQIIGPDELQFIHRSFLEYYAALSILHGGHISTILSLRNHPGWHSMVAFLAGSAFAYQADEILATLTRATTPQEDPSERQRMILLLADALGSAPEVSPGVFERAVALIRQILPPSSPHEVELVGAVAEGIATWLSPDLCKTPLEAAPCIDTLARIGTREALARIADFSRSRFSADVFPNINAAWERFNRQSYFLEVLAPLVTGNSLHVMDSEQLRLLADHGGAREIRVHPLSGIQDVSSLSTFPSLRALDLSGARALESLNGVGKASNLQRLSVAGAEKLVDCSDVGLLKKLLVLDLSRTPITSLAAIESLPQLQSLVLDGCSELEDLSALAYCRSLRSLSARGVRAQTLDPLRELTSLRLLNLDANNQEVDLRKARDLRRLRINQGISGRLLLGQNRWLERLEVRGSTRIELLAALQNCPTLRVLDIHMLVDATDLRCQLPSSIRELRIDLAPSLTSLEGIETLSKIESLTIGDAGILDLGPIAQLDTLTDVVLDSCFDLVDVRPLLRLPALRSVSLIGGMKNVDLESLELLRRNGVHVEHDPYDAVGHAGA